jgi:hypothetical protein
MKGIVIDTSVFVAAGFNPRSASARILTGICEGHFRLKWNEPTRRETEMILRRIPRLNWEKVADLFRPEGKFTESVDPDAFALISDPQTRPCRASQGGPVSATGRDNLRRSAPGQDPRGRRKDAARRQQPRDEGARSGAVDVRSDLLRRLRASSPPHTGDRRVRAAARRTAGDPRIGSGSKCDAVGHYALLSFRLLRSCKT